MANIVSSKQYINDVEVDADAALSEALFEKMGGAINYLNDTTDDHETRLSTLEAISANGNAVATGNITTTGNVQTATLTTLTTKVNVLASGIISSVGAATATITIRRDAVTLLTYTLNSAATIYLSSLLDIGATASTSHTYSIYVSAVSLGGGSIIYSNLTIGVSNPG